MRLRSSVGRARFELSPSLMASCSPPQDSFSRRTNDMARKNMSVMQKRPNLSVRSVKSRCCSVSEPALTTFSVPSRHCAARSIASALARGDPTAAESGGGAPSSSACRRSPARFSAAACASTWSDPARTKPSGFNDGT